MTDRSATDRTSAGHVLQAATFSARAHGLDAWCDASEFEMVFWTAPPGTTAVLEVSGGDVGAAELQWSTRCAELPSTRAVVLLEGPGFDGLDANFETAHWAAEAVAGFVTERSGAEAGPIEVLVFRPDTTDGTETPDGTDNPDRSDTTEKAASTWPQPTETPDGAEFRFRHRGGADVRLHLTIPQITSIPTREA